MGNFGEFEYSTDVYGVPDDLTVTAVEIVTPSLLRFTFSKDVLVNATFLNPSNYTIRNFNTSTTDANPRKVLSPFIGTGDTPALTSLYSMVTTDPLTIGSRYTFTVNNITNRTGVAIVPTFTHRYARRTKTQSAVKSLSSGYDLRSDSTAFNILAAISRSDDLIGGTEEEILL